MWVPSVCGGKVSPVIAPNRVPVQLQVLCRIACRARSSRDSVLDVWWDTAVQDGMLVMYLSNLVRAHLALADKLGTAALPIL